MRIQIPVNLIEFEEGGRTLWVQGERGAVFRVQLPLGSKFTSRGCATPDLGGSHADMTVLEVHGDGVEFCLGDEAIR